VQFYYVSDGNMTGSNWRASNSGPGTQDSVNDADIGVGRNTQLACYWPTHVFQHENGTLMQVLYNSGWDLSALDVKAAKNTPLVVLPLRGAHYSQTPANEQNQTDGRIVYRAEDGRLRTYDWQNGTQIESSKHEGLVPGFSEHPSANQLVQVPSLPKLAPAPALQHLHRSEVHRATT